ncbi:MAG: SDR family NAD(P)-dependent oxidoreductase [Rhodospirillales bacterium]|nr:SDR family NAD(P)-dependent oxidoreductase [Rhodospirillales bacterium]MDP6774041.1 SDR family NAD(P)-dependent oxidoreductase [Rhodospirillales bacterium]
MSESPDSQLLAGRHAVVTGGAGGIGRAIAERLGGLGARVSIMGRNQDRLAAAAEDMGAAAIPCDVTSEAAVEKAFAEAAERSGQVAILVNNAGAVQSAPFTKVSLEQFTAMIEVNLVGAFLCCRAVLPGMVEAGEGRIVCVASTAGLKGYPYVAGYCAAKHGVIGLTRALALEVALKGVTVNAVCPGYTDTDLVAGAIDNIRAKTGRSREDVLGDLIKDNPQGRLIEPGEVASTVAWLCAPASAAITGQAIAVAGGEVM